MATLRLPNLLPPALLGGAAVLLLTLLGCADGGDGGANFEPAESAEDREGLTEDRAVVDSVGGVQMRVTIDTWPGSPGVTQDVTPLRVTIENMSNSALSVQYKNFALISPTGEYYAALPPFHIKGSVHKSELEGESVRLDPAIEHEGFEVAPYYEPVYSNIGVYDGSFPPDSGYYETYEGQLDSQKLPTETMLNRALPEGVLHSGGRVQGFLYFEKVDPDEVNRVIYRADLTTPENGGRFGEIRIPFSIEE